MNTEVEERKLDPALALPVLDESAPREPHRQFALKHEDCFIVADSYGDIRGTGDGLFRDDTRVLSRFRLLIADRMPSLVGASLSQDNILFTANLTNLAAVGPNGREVPASAVHIDRTRFIWQDRMFERITFTNYSARAIALPVRLDFDADFRDMFELRGTTPSRSCPRRADQGGKRHISVRRARYRNDVPEGERSISAPRSSFVAIAGPRGSPPLR
ncbi:glycogen debranching N-terminal domain-containing protein [Mesorhizobium sp. M0598]|uniref:glycogen debranching N-terminal domain-containing protein n=1 Tax=Mesorhizobium sp. M0598 TaxID=2956968 RepID=UPI00333A90DF